jgi:hypothetical protein
MRKGKANTLSGKKEERRGVAMPGTPAYRQAGLSGGEGFGGELDG